MIAINLENLEHFLEQFDQPDRLIVAGMLEAVPNVRAVTLWQMIPVIQQVAPHGAARIIDWFCDAARENERGRFAGWEALK